MGMVETAHPRCRWLHLTPGWLPVVLLFVEGFLLLSQRFHWFAFNEQKGWTVLIAAVTVGMAMLLILLGLVVSRLFRWHFPFSTGALLVLTVAVAVPCSWLSWEMKNARKQRQAAEAIKKLGGWVDYDYGEDEAGRRNAEANEPSWLRNLLGNDFFHGIQFVLWGETEVSDLALARLKDMPSLKHLYFLHSLISDAGWQHIQQFKGLTKLVLSDVRFADADLARLQGMTELETLSLRGTQVTDSGLDRLRGFTRLAELDLGKTQVTGAGLGCLGGLTQLRELRLNGTRITDRAMQLLNNLENLDDLDLGDTAITDSGLKYLMRLTKLQHLTLRDSRVTDAGVEELQAALPNLVIGFRGSLVNS